MSSGTSGGDSERRLELVGGHRRGEALPWSLELVQPRALQVTNPSQVPPRGPGSLSQDTVRSVGFGAAIRPHGPCSSPRRFSGEAVVPQQPRLPSAMAPARWAPPPPGKPKLLILFHRGGSRDPEKRRLPSIAQGGYKG